MLTPSHGIEDTKCITTIVDRTQHKLERAQNPSQYTPPMRARTNNFYMCWSNPTHSSVDTCPRIHARTQSVSQYVMTQTILCQIGQKMFLNMCLPKPLPCQQGHNVYLNTSWPKTSNAREFGICVSKFVDQIPHEPAKTENDSQNVFTKPLPSQRRHKMQSLHELTKFIRCQRGQKMYLNMCWPYSSHVSENKKWILTCVDKTPPMQAGKYNISQYGLTNCEGTNCIWTCIFHASEGTNCNFNMSSKNRPNARKKLNMYLNMCWLNTSRASVEIKGISTCVNQTLSMPVSNQNVFH